MARRPQRRPRAGSSTGDRAEAGPHAAFEGRRGRVAAALMARMNRDMEAAALDLAAPCDGERVLVLGPGPGVGVEMLLARCRPAAVVAADPSVEMVRVARRRVERRAGGGGEWAVSFVVGDVTALGTGVFDVVIAVNCHQLWTPLESTTVAVAQRVATLGRLVSLTHDWAISRVNAVGGWRHAVSDALDRGGLSDVTWGARRYRSGAGTWVTARRSG